MTAPPTATPGRLSTDDDPRADLAFGTIGGLVAWAGDSFGAAEALVDGGRRWTFAELAAQVAQCGRAFMAAGLEPGDRVAVWAPNSAEWLFTALGALSAGGVLVPINTRFKGAEAAYVLSRSGARFLGTAQGFLGADYVGMLGSEQLPAGLHIINWGDEVDEDHPSTSVSVISLEQFGSGAVAIDPAVAQARREAVLGDDISDLIFTSGTTGHPKGVIATHAQSLRTFGTWASVVGLAEGDRYLIVNPFFHTFGYKAGILACLMTGATIVPEPIFDVDAVLARIDAERISVLPGPPTLYQSILSHPRRARFDLSSLRLGVTGAAIVPVELVQAMERELGFDTVLTAYGLTESCGTVTMCRRQDAPELVATTSGRAIPGLEVQVVDAQGKACPSGEPGEVIVRGYTVTRGYFEDPDATAEAIDEHGWLHTGDIGVMDDAGNLTITDRLKDMYVVGGFNVYPAEIEAVLRRGPGVDTVAVIGVPDERMGEVGCAVIVGPDDDELGRRILGWCRDEMANYKVPRFVAFIDILPTNASGKVLKRELRARVAAGELHLIHR